MARVRTVMKSLIAEETLDERHRDHELSGEWKGHRDCHVRSDWVPVAKEGTSISRGDQAFAHGDLEEALAEDLEHTDQAVADFVHPPGPALLQHRRVR